MSLAEAPAHAGPADFVAAAVRRAWQGQPRLALILGTGLGSLAELVEPEASLAYRDLPYFPRSTALAHKGRLLCGRLAGVPVVVMDGRCHLYEGYRLEQIALPVQVLRGLGADTLLVTNAAGAVNTRFAVGDVMLIEDHLNLMFLHAWWPGGWLKRSDPFGRPRQTPRLYDPQLGELALSIARRGNFPLHQGVYVGVTGPNYETRAEYRAFRRIGGDAVGMSTVPEVLAAVAGGMRVLGLLTITNVARPDAPERVDAEEVVHEATQALPKVRQIVLGLVAAMRGQPDPLR